MQKHNIINKLRWGYFTHTFTFLDGLSAAAAAASPLRLRPNMDEMVDWVRRGDSSPAAGPPFLMRVNVTALAGVEGVPDFGLLV